MNPSRHLNVWLGDDLVGTLAHDAGEHTVFEFNEAYMDMGTSRPILSLAWAFPGDEALSRKLMADPRHRSASIKAPPFFSNLLPEGGLRRRIAHQLAIHPDREFFLLKALVMTCPVPSRWFRPTPPPTNHTPRHPRLRNGAHLRIQERQPLTPHPRQEKHESPPPPP